MPFARCACCSNARCVRTDWFASQSSRTHHVKVRMRKMKVRETPELLYSAAVRAANGIRRYGWRPSRADLAQLKHSTRDARAHRTLVKAWRSAGFRLAGVMRLRWTGVMSDDLNILDSLKLSAEERKLAWREWDARKVDRPRRPAA